VKELDFSPVLQRAVEKGLVAAALVDREGNTVGLAGAIAEEEARPLVALVMHRLKSDDLSARLFAGEIVSLRLDGRGMAVGVAKRQLFLVAILGAMIPETLELVRELRDEVESMLPDRDVGAPPPWSGGAGGSGQGPAELPLIELGITVSRNRGKA
jgi:hypothetical protein